MKKKFTYPYLLLLIILLPIAANAQTVATDTIRTLVLSEIRVGDGEPRNYYELTNIGADSVFIGDYQLATVWRKKTGYYETTPNRNIVLPDEWLAPDSSYLVAGVHDYMDEYGADDEGTWPDYLKHVDYEVHIPDAPVTADPALDSISPSYKAIAIWARAAQGVFLEQHVGTDSVVVDAVKFDQNGVTDLSDDSKTIAGIPDAYGTHVIIRKTNVTQGNTNWDDQRGTSLENSEWLPIPKRGETGGMNRYFTTLGNHSAAHLNGDFVSSSSVDVDFDNQQITVPWGVYKESIMDEFELSNGIAWHYDVKPSTEDSVHNIVVSEDTLTLYAVGQTLEKLDFHLEQAPATEDMNQVFPLNRRNRNEETGVTNWWTPYYVTQDHPEMDSIGDVPFGTRIDTLFNYIEKAPEASWEIDWVDDVERVDLKRGDILKVTAADGSTKEYFLSLDSVPEPSSDAALSAITWPDAPSHVRENPAWHDDTIPDFSSSGHTYKLKIPYGMENVPALVPHPADLNAQIEVDRATTVNGTVESRTTTFTVTAEDDSTKEVYEVIFSMDKPQDKIEPFNAEPVITQIVSKQFWHNNYIEITNPGNRPIDLSNYLIGVGGGGDNPATVISGTANNFSRRYERYVPGYQYQSEVEWNSKPGIVEKDLLVNPVLQPGESFVIADIARNLDDVTEEQWDACDVIITSGNWSPVEDVRERADCRVIEEPNHNYVVAFGKPDLQINLYKITNDSIKEGTKGIGDPSDFELVDAFGDYSGNFWQPTGVEVDKFVRVDRKSAYWEPDPLPGVSGSWGDSEETSEWIVTDRDDLQAMGSPWDSNGGRLYLAYGIGFHAFDPVSVFKSTVTSFSYKVSDGYVSPQTIEGIVTGTTLSEFLSGIDKAHEDQALELLGVDGTVRTDNDELANEDTLKVTSADSSNTTRYVLSVTADGLDSDAVLTSSEYTVDYADSTGTISGIAMGTTVEEVRNNVTKPETATLNIIDDEGNLVPIQQRNFDTVYVNTQATNDIFFEVVAEDGETVITYQLQLDIGDDEAYIMSDMYDVDQELNLISLIPQGTNVATFFKHAKANEGASVKIVDKIGHERTLGAISFDDEVIVTSPDSSTQKVYYLKFQQEKSGSEAYVVSDVLGVDQSLGEIWGIQANSQINIFLGLITAAPDATVDVLDADSSVVESGELGEGYMLKVTSGDSLSQKYYDLYFSEEKPGTGAYVTSEVYTVDDTEMTISDIDPELAVGDFLSNVTPAPKADMVVKDGEGNPVESGNLGEGYSLEVTSGDGSAQVEYSLEFLETAVGDLLGDTEIRIYPNPASNKVFVEGIAPNSKILIRNVFGSLVKVVNSHEVQNGALSVEELPAGIYLINVQTENNRSNSVKLIKQ